MVDRTKLDKLCFEFYRHSLSNGVNTDLERLGSIIADECNKLLKELDNEENRLKR